MLLSAGISLNAQQTATPTQTPDAQSQPAPDAQSTQTPQAQPAQTPEQNAPATPDAQAQTTQTADTQSFTGTIVKSGDKYVFQDADTGNTYDIDHQDQVQKFEGKKVKVHGTLDTNAKMIHVQ
jgi:uncharacterized protein YdeI (BOF family)